MSDASGYAPIGTSCGDCVFRGEPGDEDCQTGRLAKYRSLDVVRDDRIVGRICNMARHRGSPWVACRNPESWLEEARKDAAIRPIAVVTVETDCVDEHGVAVSVAELVRQSPAPKKVVVVLNSDVVSRADLVDVLVRQGLPCPWSVQDIKDREPDGSRLSPQRALGVALTVELKDPLVDTATHLFVVEPGRPIPQDWFAAVERAVNVDLETLPWLEPVAGTAQHGLTVSVAVLKAMYKGDCDVDDFQPRNVADLCPSFA